jgi:dGTP triphosphohydrolase
VNVPSKLGRTSAQRVKKDGLHRTVCDFISGMTDRYLIGEHERLFGTGL